LGAVAATWNAKRYALRKYQQTGLAGCTKKNKKLLIDIYEETKPLGSN
jgi:hypothetical protein